MKFFVRCGVASRISENSASRKAAWFAKASGQAMGRRGARIEAAPRRAPRRGGGMTPAKWLNLTLIGAYLVLAMLYGWERNWPKMLYWIGAMILTTGVLLA